MMNRVLSTLVIGLMMGGCTSHVTDDNPASWNHTITKTTCCSRYADFYWLKLAKNDDVKLQIDHSSSVWNFPEGKSYFGAFQFANLSGRVHVNVKSIMANGQVLAPKVMLLNPRFEPQRTYDLTQFKIHYADALDVNRYEANLQINAEETPYMVIYTDPTYVGDKVVIPHPAKVRAIESGEPLPIVSDLTYHRSYEGKLDIAIETQSVRQHPARSPAPSTLKSLSPTPQQESVRFYHTAIKNAVAVHDIDKALALLEEAKALNIPNAQRVFVQAVNQ